jgi:hypothetical protein
MQIRRIIIRVIAVTLLLGGLVRIFASKAVFELLGMAGLWVDRPYAVYIYRILGTFVVLVGLVLLVISRDPDKNRELLKVCAGGFLLLAVVMITAAVSVHLPLRYYLPDPVYSLVLAVVLFSLSK